MSLEDLLSLDTFTVQSPTRAKDASGGMTMTPYTTKYSNVQGRVVSLGCTQPMMYGGLVFEADYKIITQQAGINNGDAILTSDGRFLKVTGVKRVNAMGTISQYYQIMCLETALTSIDNPQA